MDQGLTGEGNWIFFLKAEASSSHRARGLAAIHRWHAVVAI